MYVVLEGIDTCGKSTQINALKNYFKDAIFTCEPSDSSFGKKIKNIIFQDRPKSDIAEMFLFLADRAEHTKNILLNHKNRLIISDRSMISGIAYAQYFEFEVLKNLNLMATDNIMPDLVIILILNKNDLIYRLKNKKIDTIEKRGVEYLLKIQDKIVNTAKRLNIEILKIDANNDIDKITSIITEKIKSIYND